MFDLDPSESFFIDDSPANVEAAFRLGMRGYVYHKDTNELRNRLKEVGVII